MVFTISFGMISDRSNESAVLAGAVTRQSRNPSVATATRSSPALCRQMPLRQNRLSSIEAANAGRANRSRAIFALSLTQPVCSPSAGHSEDCLAADVKGEGQTAVQIHYLAELIGALRGDNVRISVAEPGSMILVTAPRDKSFFAGIMPIRPRSS